MSAQALELRLRGATLKRVVYALTRAYVLCSAALCGVCLSSLSASHTARAEETLSEVSVVGERSEGVTRERQAQHGDLSELTEELGLLNQRSGGDGSALFVSARGGEAHQLSLYLDELPLQGAQGRGFDLSVLPLGVISSLELLEGVRAGESGAQSARLTLRLPEPPIGSRWRAQLSANSTRGASLNASAGHGGARGGLISWLSLGGGPGDFLYRDRYDRPQRRQGASYAQGAFGLKGERRLSLGELSALAFIARLSRGEPGPEGLESRAGQSDLESAALSLTWRAARSPSSPRATLYLSTRGYHYEEDTPLWQSAEEVRHELQERQLGVSLALPVLTKKDLLSLTLNAEARLESAQVTSAGEAQGAHSRVRGGVTPELIVGEGRAVQLALSSRLDLNSEREALMNPSASLSVRRRAQGLLREGRCALRGSRAFRDPSFDERYLRGPSLIPNPSLDVEDGWWVDANCEGQLRWGRQRLSSSLTAYHQRYEPLILYLPLDPYRLQASDREGAAVSGLKLTSRARLSLPQPWPTVLFSGHLTLQTHELTSAPHTPLPFKPRQLAWGQLKLLLKPGELWLRSTHRGPVYTDRFALRTLKAQRSVDVGVGRSWRLSSERVATLNVSFHNVLNQQMSDLILRPLPSRSVWLSLSVEVDP